MKNEARHVVDNAGEIFEAAREIEEEKEKQEKKEKREETKYGGQI
jgi:hypothetical protein